MEPGTVLAGRYRLAAVLGHGGMGEVWQGHDLNLGRDVAIKLMLAALDDPLAVERFRREATIAAGLDHDGIAMVHDSGRHDGKPFIVMPLLRGQDLGGLLAPHPDGLPVPRALDLGIQLADALAYAHGKAIVHRDLKPANVLVLPGDRTKICDFGLARDLNSASITSRRHLFGTAAYMAPEQWRQAPAATSIDLYALGCLLYQLLTGSPPFAGPTLEAFMVQHLTVAPGPPRDRNPQVPQDLNDLVLALLSKEPVSHRPTAAAVLASLTRTRDRLRREAEAKPSVPTATPVACAWGESQFRVYSLADPMRLQSYTLGRDGWSRGRVWSRDEAEPPLTVIAATSAPSGDPILAGVTGKELSIYLPRGWNPLPYTTAAFPLSLPVVRTAIARRGEGFGVYAVDSAGGIWSQAWDGSHWTPWKRTKSPVEGHVTAIAVDPSGGVLDAVGTAEGRVCYRNGVLQPVTTEAGRPVVDLAYSSASPMHSCVFALNDAGTVLLTWEWLHESGRERSGWAAIPGPPGRVTGIASDKLGDGQGILIAATADGSLHCARYLLSPAGHPQWSRWTTM